MPSPTLDLRLLTDPAIRADLYLDGMLGLAR
jgi:hypothetical protein